MAAIGTHIRRARVEQGLTQRQLADKVGVTQAQVSNWERGKFKPDEAQLAKIEQVLSIVRPGPKKQDHNDSELLEASRAFGRWLERTRNEAGLTQGELAAKAGISVPAIYNIESGRSMNPRAETRRKLEVALGQTTPAEVVEVSQDASNIEGLGPLTDFEPYDENDRPGCAGVYVLYDVSDRPVYVGKADRISARIRDHEDKFWFKRPIVESAAYIEIKDKTLRHQVEQVLIKFLKSNAVINKQSVER